MAAMRGALAAILPRSRLLVLPLVVLLDLAAAFGVLKSVAGGGVPTEAELEQCTDTRPGDCKRWARDGECELVSMQR